MAVALGALVSVATLVAVAAPAAAAPLQDFTLVKNGGSQVVVAQGAVQNGVGSFTSTGSTYSLAFANGAVSLSTAAVSHLVTFDGRTCRSTVTESGTFGFSKQSGQITFAGSGTYTLAGSLQAIKVPGGCALTTPGLTQFSLTAHATEIHAVL